VLTVSLPDPPPGRGKTRETGAVQDEQRGADRFELVLVLLVYVLPLGATMVLLALVGLPGLALALLAVEAVVAAAVVLAKTPGRHPGRAVLALAVLAGLAGTGAVLLLAPG